MQQFTELAIMENFGCVNLFHPEIAYGTINADSLFIDNISDLLKNPSAANFKNAVQKMIDRLHDPYTTIKRPLKNQRFHSATKSHVIKMAL